MSRRGEDRHHALLDLQSAPFLNAMTERFVALASTTSFGG
jgi:hypothetical protein